MNFEPQLTVTVIVPAVVTIEVNEFTLFSDVFVRIEVSEVQR